MPGALPQTSTYALNNATLPYGIAIANKGYKQALLDDEALLKGLNTYNGHVTYKAVADDQGLEFVDPKTALNA
jgi:alanine dehydrogenase